MNPKLITIAESFGRTLTVMAYMDMCENGDTPRWAPTASHGADWFNKTPRGILPVFWVASVAALHLAEGWNRALLPDLFATNVLLTGHRNEPTLASFGHDLAMECLGTGCGWGDDHPAHELDLPDLSVDMSAVEHKKSLLLAQPSEIQDVFWRHGYELQADVSGPYYLEMRGAVRPLRLVPP